jgi:transposase
VPLAAWFQRRGATVVLVPAEQSADLRAYYAKSTKTDRLDAELLARLPLLHPDGLHPETTNGPGDPLKRAVKLRSRLVHRRSACMQRLDALLEILGLGWVEALGSDMTQTACKFLAGWANPHHVKRLGRARLARWFQRQTRKAWGERRADAVVAAAEATLALWGPAGLDYEALAADIATEASLALELSRQIARLDEPIFDHYGDADPDQLLLFGARGGQDPRRPDPRPARRPHRFTSLAAARSFSGLIPHQHSSGLTDAVGGPTKHGDACLREALFLAADHARKTDPTLAARYQRLMGQTGRHHTSALCTIATVLRTRIVACLRNNTPTSCAMSRQPDHPRPGPSDRRRALPDPTRGSCRPPNDQQHPLPPPQAGRAHRARSRQALHDAARPTGQPAPSPPP